MIQHASFALLLTSLVVTNSYHGPAHLQPFPTRRSSDLSANSTAELSNLYPRSCFFRTRPNIKEDGQIKQDLRSEEHTSELQSRGHLVCRLLLVKETSLFGPSSRRSIAIAWSERTSDVLQ